MNNLLARCTVSSFLFAGCGSSSPTEPLRPSAAPPSATVTIAAPTFVTPVHDEQWGWLEQPVVLTVSNAAVTGTSATPVTYEFDAAVDPDFAQIVHNVQGVPQGSDGHTRAGLPRLPLPTFLYWRSRATNGTATSPYSTTVKFELEGQGCHLSPEGYRDPTGNPISEEYAEALINGCAEEFPHTVAVYGSESEAEGYAEELLLRIIWHLKLAGFDAAQQRNPSGAISKDKMNIFIRNTWRTYDIFALGVAGRPTTLTGLGQVRPENPVFSDGIAD